MRRRGLLWAFNVLLGPALSREDEKGRKQRTASFFAHSPTGFVSECARSPLLSAFALCVCSALCVCVLLLICVFYKQRRATNTTTANAVDEVTRGGCTACIDV
jgi:hypothetical protein